MYVCMHACMYVCMYVYMYTCISVCMYEWLYVYLYVPLCVHMYLWMYVCMFLCMYVCMYVWMYVWMYVCMYVWRCSWAKGHHRQELLGKGKLQLVLLFLQEHLLEVILGPGAPPGGAHEPRSTTDRCSLARGSSSWCSSFSRSTSWRWPWVQEHLLEVLLGQVAPPTGAPRQGEPPVGPPWPAKNWKNWKNWKKASNFRKSNFRKLLSEKLKFFTFANLSPPFRETRIELKSLVLDFFCSNIPFKNFKFSESWKGQISDFRKICFFYPRKIFGGAGLVPLELPCGSLSPPTWLLCPLGSSSFSLPAFTLVFTG